MFYQAKKIIRKLVPEFLISWYHYILVFLAAHHLIVIGITGTKGKTTIAELLNSFLEKFGKQTAMVNSLRFKLGEKTWPNNLKMTMPGRFFIQKFLYQASRKKIHYAILEVTSEGIKQHRHRFIDFDVAVLINLQPEHLEAHSNSFEKYRQTKEKLFQSLNSRKKVIPICERRGQFEQSVKKTSVVNLDDESALYFLRHSADEKIGFSLKSKDTGVNILIQPKNVLLSKANLIFIIFWRQLPPAAVWVFLWL